MQAQSCVVGMLGNPQFHLVAPGRAEGASSSTNLPYMQWVCPSMQEELESVKDQEATYIA